MRESGGGHMREIGVRELKLSLSKTLRAAGRGQRVRVTVRGQPVADIVPAGTASPGESRLRELAAEGRLTAPIRTRPKKAPQLVQGRGAASALVLTERDVER
jgi:prevent-host-death family protein